jgi:hypothetical protein
LLARLDGELEALGARCEPRSEARGAALAFPEPQERGAEAGLGDGPVERLALGGYFLDRQTGRCKRLVVAVELRG